MANLPKRLREQIRLYEAEGFTIKEVERASKHYRVTFNEFPTPQFLTANNTDWRGYRNNTTRFKRLRDAHQATKEAA